MASSVYIGQWVVIQVSEEVCEVVRKVWWLVDGYLLSASLRDVR